MLRGIRCPETCRVRMALIECYLKSGKQDDAAKEIQAYLELPDVPTTDQLKLAKVLLENNEPASAQALLVSAVKTSPEFSGGALRPGIAVTQQEPI